MLAKQSNELAKRMVELEKEAHELGLMRIWMQPGAEPQLSQLRAASRGVRHTTP